MDQTGVTCPNCGVEFSVNVRATRGKCPHCSIALVFETVREPSEPPTAPELSEQTKSPVSGSQPIQSIKESVVPTVPAVSKGAAKQEKVDIVRIEQMVDALGGQRSVSKTSISEIAVIEAINPDAGHSSIDKKVDRLLRSRSKSKV